MYRRRRKREIKEKQREGGWNDTQKLRDVDIINQTLRMSPLPMLFFLSVRVPKSIGRHGKCTGTLDSLDSIQILISHAKSTLF